MVYTTFVDEATMQQWIIEKRDPKLVEDELKNKGLNEDAIAACLKEYKRIRNAKRQFTGFLFMGIGALLGFISCVLLVTNIFPGLFTIFLYGLTTLAGIFIFIGLYFVFE